jgi:ubiquinone/menaquinone biosynthesis C-methylase UbiE
VACPGYGLTNVEVVQGDGRDTGLPRGSFDLVHERLVLVNVPDPGQILEEMAALVCPGGVVVWTRVLDAVQAVSLQAGQDCFIGRRLAALMRGAGLVEVQQEVSVTERPVGHPRRMQLVQWSENIRERLIVGGFFSDAELTDALATLRRHLEDREIFQLSGVAFRAWGRKPR